MMKNEGERSSDGFGIVSCTDGSCLHDMMKNEGERSSVCTL